MMQDPTPVRAGVRVAAILLFTPLLIPLVTGRMFALMDLGWFHIPVRHLYSQALASGDSIFWTPALFRGFYVHGEGQLGALHPLHLVLYWLLPVPVAVSLELVAIYVFAFTGMRVCLRVAGLGGSAASFGALLFAFSGFNVLHLTHANHLGVAAHAPWLIAAVERALTATNGRGQAAALVGLSALIGSAVLLGSPQLVFITLLLGGGYALLRAAVRRDWSGLPLIGAAVLIGAAIGGAQLLPTLEFLGRSDRSVAAPGFAVTYSLHPMNLLQLASPYVFAGRVYTEPGEYAVHEFSIYNGAFCTVALAWLAVRARRLEPSRRAVAAFALVLCGIAAVLALGRHAGIYTLLTHLPFVDRLRAPTRFILLVHFGLAVLGAVAFDELSRGRAAGSRAMWRTLWPLAIPIGISAVTAIGALSWLGGPSVAPPHTATAGRLAVGLAAIVAATALVAAAARGSRLALTLLPVFAAADLGLWGYRVVWQRPVTVEELARSADVPPHAHPGDALASPLLPESNLAVLRNYWLTHGYAGIVVPRTLWWTAGPVRHRLSGADWSKSGGRWDRVTDPMPEARLVVDVRRSDDILRDLGGIDIARTALVDRTLPPFSGTPGTAVVKTHRPGRITIEVTSSVSALLVMTESYDPGWKAADGGGELQIVRAYGDYLAAVVPPGTRSVTFTFAPPAVRTGIALTLAGALASLAAALALRRRAA